MLQYSLSVLGSLSEWTPSVPYTSAVPTQRHERDLLLLLPTVIVITHAYRLRSQEYLGYCWLYDSPLECPRAAKTWGSCPASTRLCLTPTPATRRAASNLSATPGHHPLSAHTSTEQTSVRKTYYSTLCYTPKHMIPHPKLHTNWYCSCIDL